MNKLLWDDIRSESVRQDILNHLRREAALQQTLSPLRTRRNRATARRYSTQWRKVLSDVDDTLYCSGGSYPAGIDKRFPKKAVYPGVLAFYRELDLGTDGPEEWPDDRVGNLVFLSARPHVYKDISEKANFAKFEKLRSNNDGRKGLHTTPSLLSGDLTSGSKYLMSNDFEPLARKKFENFKRYVSIYPEYKHVFVCDNGQGDVRAGEMMFDSFPYEFEALFVHVVQDVPRTYGYAPKRWSSKEFRPVFFRTYVDAAFRAASQHPPLIRIKGLQRICNEASKDFSDIKNWPSESLKAMRRQELNHDIWRTNLFLLWNQEESVALIQAERRFLDGEKVRTPYGIGLVKGFDPMWDMYELELDWRPLDVQVLDHNEEVKKVSIRPKSMTPQPRNPKLLETVVETDEGEDDGHASLDVQSVDIEAGIAATPALTTEKDLDGSTQEVGQSSAETFDVTIGRSHSLPEAKVSEPLSPVRAARSVSEGAVITAPLAEIESTGVPTKKTFRVAANICGRFITAYTPPVLPKLQPKTPATSDKQKASIFNFLQSGADATPKKASFKPGDQVRSPYGLGVVAEYRPEQGMVVVEMAEWHATGYIRDTEVKKASKSLLGSLIRQLSTSEKPLEFPHAQGTVINTPYGRARVTRPIPLARSIANAPAVKRSSTIRPPTLGLALESWTLANGSHPVLYCTTESARSWKDQKEVARNFDSGSILTKIVSSSRTLLEPFLSQKQTHKEEPPKLHTQYYQDAAAVSTSFGYGTVKSFRPSTGIYEISLTQWNLADGSHPTAYLRKEDLSHRVAKLCNEGYPVLTSLGVSGTLASVVPTTGVHIVTVPSCGMVCYLQPDHVIRPLKAAVGEEVLTAYGEGRVERYNAAQDMYTIELHGWGAKLFAKGDTFERVSDGVPDRDGVFGVKWLLSFLFNMETQAQPRSRSNSIVSTQSHSNRSNA
jgi:predicted heme/steroid binding protein